MYSLDICSLVNRGPNAIYVCNLSGFSVPVSVQSQLASIIIYKQYKQTNSSTKPNERSNFLRFKFFKHFFCDFSVICLSMKCNLNNIDQPCHK